MTTTDQLQRVAGSERIASLDVIRGIAILFILVMNIPWMGGYEFQWAWVSAAAAAGAL